MRRFGITLFLLLYGSTIAVTHFLFAVRLVLLPDLPSPWCEIALASLTTLGALLFLRPIADRFVGERWPRALSWPAFVWLGVSFYLLIFLLGSDLLLSLAASAAWAIGEAPSHAAVSHVTQGILVVAAAGLFSVWGLWLGLGAPVLRRVDLRLARWPRALDGFRIVQISDVHIGELRRRGFAAHLTERVNALRPDLVAVTGDLVDGRVERLGVEVEPFGELRAKHGVFFVTGNHDYFSGADPWLERVRALGFRVLRNERVEIGGPEASFDLAGIDDHFAHHFGGDHGADLPRSLAGRDAGRAVVLLAHNPAIFDHAASLDVDLQLSGHTHGGQIWPFRYLVRLATPYIAGLYRRGEATLYVSRGTGFWGPPMRLFHPGEITEITLHAS